MSDEKKAAEIDIDTLYGVDEEKTVWLNFGRAGFLCRHFDRSSVLAQKIAAELAKPHRKLITAGMLKPEQDRELAVRVFVRAAVIDWRDVVLGGINQGSYNEEKAVALLVKYSALFNDLISDASDINHYRPLDADDIKN